MGYALTFGAFSFPQNFLPQDLSGGLDIAAQPRPRASGSNTQKGRTTDRSLAIMGEFTAASVGAWNSAVDAILSACLGDPADLYYGRDDRYYREAQLTSWGLTDPVANGRLWGVFGRISLTFTAARFPEAFGLTTYTPALTSGGGTINYSPAQGDAETFPVWSLTIGTGGAGTIRLQNSATGDFCIISKAGGFTSGDVITVDRLNSAATLNAVAVVGLFDRRIPTLKPGNNTIAVTVTPAAGSALSVSALAVTYVGRWKS